MIDVDTLDQRIAEDLLGEEYNHHWHRFTVEPEHAERLAEWLAEHGIRPELEGSSVVLRRRKERLFAQTGDTPMIALARAAVRLLDERPELLRRFLAPDICDDSR